MAVQKEKVYYISSGEGVSKKTGKPFKVVNVLTFNNRFGKFDIRPLFCDKIPEICSKLNSGDVVEVEFVSEPLGGSIFKDITRKIADNPLSTHLA